MRSIAVNANNDIYRGADGNLAMVTGIDAVSQGCTHAVQTLLGSLTNNLLRGVDYFGTMWNFYRPMSFAAQARAILLTVPHVQSVTYFDITRANGVASYTAGVKSDYGPLEISGNLSQ